MLKISCAKSIPITVGGGISLVPIQQEFVPELARICYTAFSALHDRHAVHRNIPDINVGMQIISHVTTHPNYTGIVATVDGQPIGSNFLQHSDFVAGIGPISVDPRFQSHGVGRILMQWAIDEVHRRGIRQTRLFQEAINTTSLSLYASLGFTWRDSAVLMQATPAIADDPTIRSLTIDDLDRIEFLSLRGYGASRAEDAERLSIAKFPGFVRERDKRIVGYSISSLFGHASAETDEDLLTLIAHAARHVPPDLATFICPLSRPDLFRKALVDRHCTLKVLSYMSLGEFTPPPGAYLPSIQC
jgi:GNAT superfamily N-acetyltransferase